MLRNIDINADSSFSMPSSSSSSNIIEYGDIVMVSFGRSDNLTQTMTAGAKFENKFGIFWHDAIVGLEWGSRISSAKSKDEKQRDDTVSAGKATAGDAEQKGAKKKKLSRAARQQQWLRERLQQTPIYALRPTPELWISGLPMRTQVIYTRDASFITTHLDLKPGMLVVESGTGSGALTMSLARAVAPHGHVHTFDFHAERVTGARQDMSAVGLSALVTCRHGDACAVPDNSSSSSASASASTTASVSENPTSLVFGFRCLAAATVDACFLDLPNPVDALGNAERVMKAGGRLCSFSPCIEQVQAVCQYLTESNRFSEIETFECLYLPVEVKRVIPFQEIYRGEPERSSDPGDEDREQVREDERAASSPKKQTLGRKRSSSDLRAVDHDASLNDPSVGSRFSKAMRGHTAYLTFATLSKKQRA